MKINNKNNLSGILVGVLTLLGLFTIINLAADKRTSYKEESQKAPVFKRRYVPIKSKKNRNVFNDERKVVKADQGGNNNSQEELPTIEKMRSRDLEDIVHGQATVINAGKAVGRIVDLANHDSSKVAQAVEYLSECSSNKKIYTPIRALCLDYLINKKQEWGHSFDITSVDKKVLNLQQLITKL